MLFFTFSKKKYYFLHNTSLLSEIFRYFLRLINDNAVPFDCNVAGKAVSISFCLTTFRTSRFYYKMSLNISKKRKVTERYYMKMI